MVDSPSSPLRTVALFASCSADELELLQRRLRRRHYGRDQPIFLEGDPGTGLYIVESGRVKLSLHSADGKEVIFDLLGPGAFFGELALLDGEPRSADATALEPSVLSMLDRDSFLQVLAEQPGLAAGLLAALSRRLRRDARLIGDAAFLDVPARLARVLLDLHPPQGASARLTQTELAGLVGTTRVSVNKWLQFFQQQGLIAQQRGHITILDRAGLEKRIY